MTTLPFDGAISRYLREGAPAEVRKAIEKQQMVADTTEDLDVIGLAEDELEAAVQVFFVRGGRNNGNRAFFPTHTRGEEPPEVLAAFIAQFYDDKPIPKLILVSTDPAEEVLLEEAFCQKSGRKVGLLGHVHTVKPHFDRRDAAAHTQFEPPTAQMVEHADLVGQSQRVVQRQGRVLGAVDGREGRVRQVAARVF